MSLKQEKIFVLEGRGVNSTNGRLSSDSQSPSQVECDESQLCSFSLSLLLPICFLWAAHQFKANVSPHLARHRYVSRLVSLSPGMSANPLTICTAPSQGWSVCSSVPFMSHGTKMSRFSFDVIGTPLLFEMLIPGQSNFDFVLGNSVCWATPPSPDTDCAIFSVCVFVYLSILKIVKIFVSVFVPLFVCMLFEHLSTPCVCIYSFYLNTSCVC